MNLLSSIFVIVLIALVHGTHAGVLNKICRKFIGICRSSFDTECSHQYVPVTTHAPSVLPAKETKPIPLPKPQPCVMEPSPKSPCGLYLANAPKEDCVLEPNNNAPCGNNAKAEFNIGKSIGKGLSAEIFAATHVHTRQTVAIKKYDIGWVNEFFIEEMIAAKKFHHKNIIGFVDSLQRYGQCWIVMEYMDGGSLHSIVGYVKMGEDIIAAISREILEGLNFLHTEGIVHCDMTEANVLLSRKGEVKISDFGCSMNFDLNKSLAEFYQKAKFDVQHFGLMLGNMINTCLKTSMSYELQEFRGQCIKGTVAKELLKHPFLKKAADTRVLAEFIRRMT